MGEQNIYILNLRMLLDNRLDKAEGVHYQNGSTFCSLVSGTICSWTCTF